MKKALALLLLVALTACSPEAPQVSRPAYTKSSPDARIVADATRALPGYEWQEEEEFFTKTVYDNDELIGAVIYWYSTATDRLFTSNITPFINTEDQDYAVWDEWNELDIYFFGEGFMTEVWDWEIGIDDDARYPQDTVIGGRAVELDFSADKETFIMSHIFEVTP